LAQKYRQLSCLKSVIKTMTRRSSLPSNWRARTGI